MDESTRKACFDEISHQICDADAKVNINDISSNWQVNLRDSERLLWDWFEQSQQKSLMSKEFLIRGVDPQGHCVISVIKECQLAAVEKMFPQCSHSLFSLERPAASALAGRLGMHQLSTAVVVNLPIEPKSRDGKNAPASAAAKPTDKSSASTTNTTSNGIHKPAAPKVEPKVVSPPAKSTSVVAAVAPKVEPETPTKKSTTVSPKKSASKTAAPPATGKSSIASFFARPAVGAKVATAVAAADKPKPKPIDVAKDEPMDTSDTNNDSPPTSVAKANASKSPKSSTEKRSPNTADLAASRKRSLADLVDSDDGDEDGVAITPSPAPVSKRKRTAAVSEKKRAAGGKKSPAASTSSDAEEIPGTPQAEPVKKATSAGASVGRGSRVRQIVDSSDEEPETLVEAKKAVKRKAKRTVTRTFEDEDGYIKTVKETEEYTCSEDEEIPPKRAAPSNGTGSSKSSKPPAKNSPPVKKPPAKISPPAKAASSKQGSIMNFFKKK